MLTAFGWLLREWHRPIGQLLRSLPNMELRGNGAPIDGSKDCRSKDPALLLEYHLANLPRDFGSTPNLFSLQSSFSPEDSDEGVVITCAVFLCLFDSVYRLTCGRVDPDRLLRHYHTLLPYVLKRRFVQPAFSPRTETEWLRVFEGIMVSRRPDASHSKQNTASTRPR